MKSLGFLVLALSACGGSAKPEDVWVAVGVTTTHGYGQCYETKSDAITATPDPKNGVVIKATAVGDLAVDCIDKKWDANVKVRAAVSYDLVSRHGDSTIKVGDALPTLCVVGRDAEGHALDLGDSVEPTFDFGAGVGNREESKGAPDHGMGAAAFSSRTSRSCTSSWGKVATKAGPVAVTAKWDGGTVTHTLKVEN